MFATGSPSVEYVLAHNTSESLEEIIAYYDWEPYGGNWEQTSLLAYVAAAVGGSKTVKPDTFMPAKPKRQKPVEIFATICSGAGAPVTHDEFTRMVGEVKD